MDRRRFFTAAGRFVLFGSLVAVSAVCLKKEGGDAGACLADKFCSRCGVLAGCDLPEALKEKLNIDNTRM
jgi:hypothetical protein